MSDHGDQTQKKRFPTSIVAMVVIALGVLFVLPNLPALSGKAVGGGAEDGCGGGENGLCLESDATDVVLASAAAFAAHSASNA